jgi:hypothetical protein
VWVDKQPWISDKRCWGSGQNRGQSYLEKYPERKWLVKWIKKCNRKLRLSALSKSYACDVDDDDVQGRSKKNKVEHGKKDYELKFL